MYKSHFSENSKFVLMDHSPSTPEEVENSANSINEFHYTGGIGIIGEMQEYEKNMNMGGMNMGGMRDGVIEKHEYKEFETKAVPFSLAYLPPKKRRLVGPSHDDVKVMPEDLYNKLFFSVAHEVNEKGNRKTMKKMPS
jgi:hypothetical protein